MTLDLDKLLHFGVASMAGAFAAGACWGSRVLSSRSVRRPYASAAVNCSLGLVFGLASSLAIELHWECNLAGKVLSALLSGSAVGLWGPSALLRRVAGEVEIWWLARQAIPRTDHRRDDTQKDSTEQMDQEQ